MNLRNNNLLLSLSLLIVLFSACTPEDLPVPPSPRPPVEEQPPVPVTPPARKWDTLQLSAAIQVGTLMYDSLAAAVTVTSVDSNGTTHTQALRLLPGKTKVPLERKFVRHTVTMQHWGLTDAISFTREELQAQPVRLLSAQRAARRLKEEQRYILIMDEWKQESKSAYTYNTDGTLATATYFHKKARIWELQLNFTDEMRYAGGKLRSVLRHDEEGRHVGTTLFAFAGNEATLIRQEYKGTVVQADVSYSQYYGSRQVSIRYTVDGKESLRSNQFFSRGNRSGMGIPDPVYAYDGAINPKALLNLPTIHEPLPSRNNIEGLAATYTGPTPANDPYRYRYTYDAEGYVVSVLKDYKAAISGEHLYTTKTVFVYE